MLSGYLYEQLPEAATILAAASPLPEGLPKQANSLIYCYSDVLQIIHAAGTGDA